MLTVNRFVMALIRAMDDRIGGLSVLLDRALLTSGDTHHP